MRNVTVSSAVSHELYTQSKEAASKHKLSLSSLIGLALRQLLSLDPERLAELCSAEAGNHD